MAAVRGIMPSFGILSKSDHFLLVTPSRTNKIPSVSNRMVHTSHMRWVASRSAMDLTSGDFSTLASMELRILRLLAV